MLVKTLNFIGLQLSSFPKPGSWTNQKTEGKHGLSCLSSLLSDATYLLPGVMIPIPPELKPEEEKEGNGSRTFLLSS
jgi:hypothetical protein